MPFDTVVKKMHDSSSTETMTTIYQTGYFDITDMDKKALIRRVNLNYTSAHNITCYVFTDNATSMGTLTFPANNSSGSKQVSRRPSGGIRAKSVAIKLQVENATSDITIRKIEVEVDE